jgi:hypothetical protein
MILLGVDRVHSNSVTSVVNSVQNPFFGVIFSLCSPNFHSHGV